MSNFLATILGNPDFPSIREVNVRSGPAITNQFLFTAPLGLRGTIKSCESDTSGSARSGKIYVWLHIDFNDGRSGWVRDDLIEVEGDGGPFGYGFVAQRLQAFKLVRTPVIPAGPTENPTPDPVPSKPDKPVNAGPAIAITMARDGVNLRRGPGTVHPVAGRFPYLTRCDILDAKQEDNRASRFTWVNVRANNTTGWIREDYLRYEGDVSGFKLTSPDSYPAPMQNSHWVRDWNTDPNFSAIHYGWDLGAAVGESVIAGPAGGLVIQVNHCTACSPGRPNVLSNGIRLNDPAMLQNPAWGYGYGNFVVVRYTFDQLPASSQAELARRNLPNYHIFTIYAHLNTIEVNQGQTTTSGQRIGTCGNTGNSEAPHLHLEIRAWNNANELSFGRMISNRLDPIVLFRR